VIGLMFVFLLLSLLATAINEYISAVMNLRGKELARGLGRLLDDFDEKNALTRAFNGVGPRLTEATDSLTERFYNHRLIRPLATRRGGFFQLFSKEPRLPSYIPARTFAMALLDVLGIDTKEANLRTALPGNQVDPAVRAPVTAEDVAAAEKTAAEAADAAKKARTAADAAPSDTALAKAATDAEGAVKIAAADLGRVRLAKVLQILKLESPFDVKEHLQNLDTLLTQTGVPADVRTQLVTALTGTQTQLQQLHDSVEVWFNNSMDRVSGAYKRTVQGWLFIIGVFIASCSNADTIDMWRRLSENDKLRDAMAARAAASIAVMDSVVRPPTRTDTLAQRDTTTQRDTPIQRDTAAQRDTAVERDTTVQRDTATQRDTTVQRDTTRSDTVEAEPAGPRTPLDSAQFNYRVARARLDSLELKLGWTRENRVSVGLLDTARARRDSIRRVLRVIGARAQAASGRKAATDSLRRVMANPGAGTDTASIARRLVKLRQDSIAAVENDRRAVAAAKRSRWRDGLNLWVPITHPGPFWAKVLGLFLTAIAISLGAPFWFDLLNKVISIRAAGRAPNEKPKSPEGPPKRAAEHTPM
jgi:hypothetical protein